MIFARYEGFQCLVSIRLLQHESLHQVDVNVWTHSMCTLLQRMLLCILQCSTTSEQITGLRTLLHEQFWRPPTLMPIRSPEEPI